MASLNYVKTESVVKKDLTIEKLFGLGPLMLGEPKMYDEYIKLHGLPNDIHIIDPKTLVGIEVEIENILKIDPNLLIGFWEQRTDGSLRDRGFEFVTPPLPASYTPAAVTALFRYMNDTIKFSKRTSVHVHMNVRNLTPAQLFNILYVYHVIEPLLFKFVGGERDKNIFCVPWTSSSVFQEATGLPLKQALQNFAEQSHKYTALNLVPIKKFGTIEFRHLPGIKDIPKIIAWINLILCLKVYALRHSQEELLATITNLNTNSQYIKFIENVFGIHSALLDMSSIQQDLEGQVTNIKESVVGGVYHKEIVEASLEGSHLGKVIAHFLGKQSLEYKKATTPKYAMINDFAVNPARPVRRDLNRGRAEAPRVRVGEIQFGPGGAAVPGGDVGVVQGVAPAIDVGANMQRDAAIQQLNAIVVDWQFPNEEERG